MRHIVSRVILFCKKNKGSSFLAVDTVCKQPHWLQVT